MSALNDQIEPLNSNDQSCFYFHWWPRKGSSEWIQYDFSKQEKVSSAKVYWFDDGPWGGCRVPVSWKLFYKTDSNLWKPVTNLNNYGLDKDQYNEIRFESIETTALKMEVQLPVDNSAGIYEWSIK